MKVVVTGGRDYSNRMQVFLALDKINKDQSITMLAHGGAKGADEWAHEWAEARKVECRPYHANWERYHKGAGPKRNTLMLENFKPDLVLAFPGGTGTEDCVSKAILMKIPVIKHDI